jgi:hypothetical protein
VGSSDPYEAIRKNRKGKPRLEQWLIAKYVHTMLKTSSWKTSLGGIGGILGAVGFLLSEFTSKEFSQINWAEVTLACGVISAGVGSLFAKDKDKTNAPSPSVTKQVPEAKQ